MSTKAVWPEEVPILEAKDFCRGAFDGPNGTHCLLGHCMQITEWRRYELNAEFRNAIMSAARDLKAARVTCIFDINDAKENSTALLARIWNLAMAKLGYVVNNPEARRTSKRKTTRARKTKN